MPTVFGTPTVSAVPAAMSAEARAAASATAVLEWRGSAKPEMSFRDSVDARALAAGGLAAEMLGALLWLGSRNPGMFPRVWVGGGVGAARVWRNAGVEARISSSASSAASVAYNVD